MNLFTKKETYSILVNDEAAYAAVKKFAEEHAMNCTAIQTHSYDGTIMVSFKARINKSEMIKLLVKEFKDKFDVKAYSSLIFIKRIES